MSAQRAVDGGAGGARRKDLAAGRRVLAVGSGRDVYDAL